MVVQSLDQLEKNVSASFGYVKKDLLMLNDALSDINDKIQHLSLNHAALLERLERVLEKKDVTRKKTIKKKTVKSTEKKEIEFYDLKTKKKFKTSKYSFRIKSGRRFAVATSPSGSASWRVLGTVKTNKTSKKGAPKKIVTETIEY